MWIENEIGWSLYSFSHTVFKIPGDKAKTIETNSQVIQILKLWDMELKVTVMNMFKMENFSREVDSIKI